MTIALHRHFIEQVERQPAPIRAMVFEAMLALPTACAARPRAPDWAPQAACAPASRADLAALAGLGYDVSVMENSRLLYEVVDRVAILTLNHPQKRNPLSRAVLAALKEHLQQIAADDAVRAVIIRAAGPAFSAGHDLGELADASEVDRASLFELCTEVMELIRKLPRPVIAQVQGIATAAGCQLVATCDLVVASEDATFATPGVKIGLFCTTPGVALSRAVGTKKAMEMLLTGTPISAQEAERIGLVNRVVPAERLADETMKLARQIIAASAHTIGLGKRAFYEQLPLDRPAAYRLAQQVMVENARAHDAQEGMRAFLEKRPPTWKDR